MTNLGPLTTTYTATGADCTSTYIGANNDNQWIQYGQPNTTECVPPNFTAFDGYYYSPGICPSGYTYACEAGVGSSTTQATCCPVGYVCRADYNRDTDPFACASFFTSNTYLAVEFYQFTSQTDASTTGTVSTISKSTTWYLDGTIGYNVEAYGPIVRRSAGDPEWSGSSSSTSSGSGSTSISSTSSGSTGTASATTGSARASAAAGGSSGSGLSVGASVGIGVGVGLGCIVFIGCIAAAYIIGRRRRRDAQRGEQGGDGEGDDKAGGQTLYRGGVPVEGQVAELNSGWRPWELQAAGDYSQVPEMDGRGHRSELGSASLPVELPGQVVPPPSGHPGHARG